ncbi:MAG TPA: anti-sigma factor [Actinophytocola sp.]|jgi:anti-sigma-K factor RskA|uniref:anti-sigma factor n=1 Tax=Actinophytocola sp. TaxID=1872138 RepID=UPI002E0097A5|nr:anti-sigma factor [Actinophytocola sp.]
MSPDVHALTGAYALDAVPELERVSFERHLAECDACTQEVRELRDTAARLGQSAAADPPPWLKSRVLARVSEVRQLPPDQLPRVETAQRRSPWALRLTSAAAAVLLVVAAALGVIVVRQQGELDDTRPYAALLQAPDAKFGTGTASTGSGSATVLASRNLGQAVVITKDMPQPGAGKVYQAWFLKGAEAPRSAGLMQGNELKATGLGDADRIGITEEKAGGADQPSMEAIIQVGV